MSAILSSVEVGLELLFVGLVLAMAIDVWVRWKKPQSEDGTDDDDTPPPLP